MKIWAWHLPKQFIICQIFTPYEMWIGLLPGNRKSEDSTYLQNIIVYSISRYVTLTSSQTFHNLTHIHTLRNISMCIIGQLRFTCKSETKSHITSCVGYYEKNSFVCDQNIYLTTSTFFFFCKYVTLILFTCLSHVSRSFNSPT